MHSRVPFVQRSFAALTLVVGVFGVMTAAAQVPAAASFGGVRDPGVRQVTADALAPPSLLGVTPDETTFYLDGLSRFQEVDVVSGAVEGQGNGLGPRFNSDSCSSCHSYPVIGGSSPAVNPLPALAVANGGNNQVPWFITHNGPIREVRFVSSNGLADGGVHNLFVVSGRSDAGSCNITQPNFGPPGDPVTGLGGSRNIVFRIPTPVMGAGLIESIPDSTILAGVNANTPTKRQMGVQGHANAVQGGNVNRSGNDGTVTRFGWKAQNKSLLIFAGEAYNVEMGISNQVFPQERDETPACSPDYVPNDTLNFPNPASPPAATPVLSDVEGFANFMRLLAPPAPAPATASSQRGNALFASVGCALCHTPSMMTGATMASGSYRQPSVALSHQRANLFSDLLVHHMGTRLADGITQGAAGPDEFRTAPLWGVGQRVYFLHDGRTSDLITAIQDHASPGSEANQVVQRFSSLNAQAQQDLINFLRSL